MTVETFDPLSAKPEMNRDILARLLEAGRHLDADAFGLSQSEVEQMAPLVRTDQVDWQALVADLGDAEVESLIRLFTLAEGTLAGWESGARSPVIPLAAELKQRSVYPSELTAWIKAHTSNRFLPYGSLLDRL